MKIGEVSSQGISSISKMTPFYTEAAQMKEIYSNSICSLKSRHRIGETIMQMVETFAMLALLPFFIYTFFLASVSLIFLPVLLILIPFVIMGDLVREILHTFLPWIFPDPRYRY
ncbi:MAG: hypothetical protein K1000chlam3_00621 [Chlamydiae bacterium]|nr:hypothetical protein [Chlamydiota bacterium]